LWVFDSWCRLHLLLLQPKSNLANSSHSTWHVLFLQYAYFSFQQLHSIVGNNYMSTSFEFHVPSSTHLIFLKNIFPLHRTLGTWWCSQIPSKLHQQHSRSKYASNILQVRNPISPKLLKPQTLNIIWHELLSWYYCLAFKHGDSFLDMNLG
jgi:hypothetical protein